MFSFAHSVIDLQVNNMMLGLVGQGPFFNRTTKPKPVISTQRNGFDSHMLKSENQTPKNIIYKHQYSVHIHIALVADY